MTVVRDVVPTQPDLRAAALALWTRTAAILVVVLIPLLVTPWGSDAYNRVKALTLAALAAVMAVGWLAAGAVTRRQNWRVTRPELALWCFVLAVLVSSQTSVDPWLTFLGSPGRYEGLIAVLSYALLYCVGVQFFGSASGFWTLTIAAAWTALIVIGYGIVQVFLPPLFMGEAEIRQWYETFGVPRPPSTLGSPIVFGGYLALMVPLLVAAALRFSRLRALWLLGSALGYVAALMTMTRAAWLAVLIGTALFAAAIGREALRRHGVPLAVVILAVVITGIALTTATTTPVQVAARASSSLALQSGSLAQRVYIWERTLNLIEARPWLGWGLETLREVFPYDRAPLVQYFGLRPVIVDKAHNDVLQVAVSIGVPGAIAYLAFWSLVVTAAVRVWRRSSGGDKILAAGWLAAIASYLVQVQFSFSVVALAPLVWLFAGAACGWESSTQTTGTREQGNEGTLRLRSP